jgi:hypothetical protein
MAVIPVIFLAGCASTGNDRTSWERDHPSLYNPDCAELSGDELRRCLFLIEQARQEQAALAKQINCIGNGEC